MSNHLFRGPRGDDCAYWLQNVLIAENSHRRPLRTKGHVPKKEALTLIGAFVQMLTVNGIHPDPKEIAALLHDEKNNTNERRKRAKEVLVQQLKIGGEEIKYERA